MPASQCQDDTEIHKCIRHDGIYFLKVPKMLSYSGSLFDFARHHAIFVLADVGVTKVGLTLFC